ncbi:MAG TPA: TonB-dependent receptor [Terracidiphilus sp.]|nr:TonB-dependent receptor [Terracidiphilus sp.]
MIRAAFRPAAILVAVIIAIFFPYSASAQTEHVSITGVVKDQRGAVVPDAKIAATRIESGTVATTTTNADGIYIFAGLEPGHFRISVTKLGFKEVSTNDFTVGAQTTAEQNVTLSVGSASETIQVTAAPDGFAALDSSSATRTDTPLIEVPQSVETITHAVLVQQDVHKLADALASVSGVTPTKPEELLFTPPIVRGFPAEVYLDGLPIFGGNQQAFDPTSLVGVERIEVLKGPNSTLYGGGLGTPLGGIINIESERPADSLNGIVAFRGGNFTTRDPYVDLNAPLGSRIAGRLAGEYLTNQSWIDLVKGDHWSVQPSILFQIDSRTDLLLQGQINDRSQLEYSGLPAAQALAGQIDRNAFPGSPIGQPETTDNNRMVTPTLRHAFTDRLKLAVTGRYYDSSINENGSFVDPQMFAPDPSTPTVYPVIPITLITDTKEGAFDANILANADLLGGVHAFLAGVDYDWTSFYSGMGLGVNASTVGTIDLANPVYTLVFASQTPVNYIEDDHYKTLGGYVQDQATYRRFHLTAALRFTQLKFLESSNYGVANDSTYHHVSPRVGATFDVAPGVALYAGYSTAFRAAFAFVGVLPPKPETSRSTEGGLKLALPRAGLSGTIAFFDQTHNNVATPDPANPGFSVQVGQQRAKGAEADLIWEPTRAFSLLANYAYTEAAVTQDNAIPIGNVLARVPRNSGRVAARYRVQHGAAEGLSFGSGVTGFSARQDTLPNTLSTPGYAVVDAQAAYDFGRRYTIEGSAVNLTDRHTFDPFEYFGFPVVMPNQPLSAYVTLKIHFNKE